MICFGLKFHLMLVTLGELRVFEQRGECERNRYGNKVTVCLLVPCRAGLTHSVQRMRNVRERVWTSGIPLLRPPPRVTFLLLGQYRSGK
jgi:hypothetical protein